MNKLVLTLAIFAFVLFPQVLSQSMRGSNERELGSIGTINLGNIGTIIGGIIGGTKNTTNSTTNTTAPANNTTTNTTAPVSNNTNTSAPSNNTSSGNTTVPTNNTTTNTTTNTTAPVSNNTNTSAPSNNTSSGNTTAPVTNSTSPVNNSTSSNNTSSTPVDNSTSTNTTQPSNSTTNSTTPVDSTNSTNSSEPNTPVTPVDTNWYARNDVDRAAFKQKCLDIHNILRGAVGVAPVTWSDSLAASAQDWANNMAVNGFRHSGRTGENIASTTYSTKVTVRLLGLWTKEQDWFIKGCTYPKCSSTGDEVGHYTQMVWAKTTQVGCGFAPGVNKQWNYLCCQYYRAGNVIGQTVYPYTAPAV